jgi:hypothetical protein
LFGNAIPSDAFTGTLKEAGRTKGDGVEFRRFFFHLFGNAIPSDAFTGTLKEAGVTISMDGRGRALDNIFVERLCGKCGTSINK